jgi:polar amino acid transport system substrate-binding protein
MIVISIHGFSYLAKQLGFDEEDYEQVWQVNKIGNYFAFNINTPDEVINIYQKAFDDIAKQRLIIKESYELPLAEY